MEKEQLPPPEPESRSEIVFLKDTPFCFMDLATTKVIFENFFRYPSILKDLEELEECLYNNVYSGVLRKVEDDDRDTLYHWLEEVRSHKNYDEELKKEVEAKSPVLTLEGNGNCYRIEFSIFQPTTSKSKGIIIQIGDQHSGLREKECRLISDHLNLCHRGLIFSEAFYNYGIVEINNLMERIRTHSETPRRFLVDKEKVLFMLKELTDFTTWTQLHQITDIAQWTKFFAQSFENPIPQKAFNEYQNALLTLTDLIELGMAVAQYSRHQSDIGQIRRRVMPYGLDEQKYRRLITDFTILMKMMETCPGETSELMVMAERCMDQLHTLDMQVLNVLFPRLISIGSDLSQELDKIVCFTQELPEVITSNYYTQSRLSHFLINTLKYVVIEHLEIPKERMLSKKPIVCKLKLSISQDEENAYFTYYDDGIKFNTEVIMNRAVEVGLISRDLGEWMLANDESNIYNLMLKPSFGPPVKPPPLTCYRPYLSMISEEAISLQGRMTFHYENGFNVIRLAVPKERNGIGLNPPKEGESLES